MNTGCVLRGRLSKRASMKSPLPIRCSPPFEWPLQGLMVAVVDEAHAGPRPRAPLLRARAKPPPRPHRSKRLRARPDHGATHEQHRRYGRSRSARNTRGHGSTSPSIRDIAPYVSAVNAREERAGASRTRRLSRCGISLPHTCLPCSGLNMLLLAQLEVQHLLQHRPCRRTRLFVGVRGEQAHRARLFLDGVRAREAPIPEAVASNSL